MNQEPEQTYKFQVFRMLGEMEGTSPLKVCRENTYVVLSFSPKRYIVVYTETKQAFLVVPQEKKVELLYGAEIEEGTPVAAFLKAAEMEQKKEESKPDQDAWPFLHTETRGGAYVASDSNPVTMIETPEQYADFSSVTTRSEDAVIFGHIEHLSRNMYQFHSNPFQMVAYGGYLFNCPNGTTIRCIGHVRIDNLSECPESVPLVTETYVRVSNSRIYHLNYQNYYFRNWQGRMIKISQRVAAALLTMTHEFAHRATNSSAEEIRSAQRSRESGYGSYMRHARRGSGYYVETGREGMQRIDETIYDVIPETSSQPVQGTDRITRVVPERDRQQELQNRYRQQAHSRRR